MCEDNVVVPLPFGLCFTVGVEIPCAYPLLTIEHETFKIEHFFKPF